MPEALKQQDVLNNAADERAQKLADDKYGTEREIYAHNTESQADAILKQKADDIAANRAAITANVQKAFDASQQTERLKSEQSIAAGQQATTLRAAQMQITAQAMNERLNREQQERDITLRSQEATAARKSNFLLSGPGQTLSKDVATQSDTYNRILTDTNRYLAAAQARAGKKPPGGGFLNSFAPNLTRWNSEDMQKVSALSSDLQLASAKSQAGGRLTNNILDMVGKTKPGPMDLPNVQIWKLNALKDLTQKQLDYQQGRIQAAENNDTAYDQDHNAYMNATFGQKYVPFAAWRASHTKLDAAGNPRTN
jgi:hypothetical protein